jgi:hypothetical protein
MGPPPPAPNYEAQQHLAQWLNGLVPSGPPRDCLASYKQQEMTVIDSSTIAFREGTGHVWVQKTQSPCTPLGGPGPYALVTRSSQSQLCRGDIAEVVDTASGTNVGSCVIGEFLPYSRPR